MLSVIQHIQHLWRQSITIRNISRVYVGNIISTAINVGTALILIRGLSVTDYSFYVAFNSLAVLSSGLVGNGINIALVRFSAEQLSLTDKKPYSIYFFALFSELGLFLPLIIVAAAFPSLVSRVVLGSDAFSKSILAGIFYGLGLMLLQMGRGVYQAEQRFNMYVGTQWLRQALTVLLLAGFWLTNRLSFETAAWTIAALSLIVGAGVIIYGIGLPRSTSVLRQVWNERGEFRQLLTVAGWLMGYYFFLSAFGQLDIITLSRFTSQTEVAIYGVAFRYFSMVLLLLEAIHAVLLPKFSQASMEKPEAQKSFLKRWLSYSVWVIIPVILFILFGKQPFIWLNGENYANSFYIVCIFAVGIWLSLMFSPLSNILLSRRDFRFLFFLGACALVTAIIGNLLLVPVLKGIGAAIVVVIANNFVLQFPILWRVLKWKNHRATAM